MAKTCTNACESTCRCSTTNDSKRQPRLASIEAPWKRPRRKIHMHWIESEWQRLKPQPGTTKGEECLIKSVVDVIDTIVTSKSRGSLLMTPRQRPLLIPRQTKEVLRDDSDRLRAMLLISGNFLHDGDSHWWQFCSLSNLLSFAQARLIHPVGDSKDPVCGLSWVRRRDSFSSASVGGQRIPVDGWSRIPIVPNPSWYRI